MLSRTSLIALQLLVAVVAIALWHVLTTVPVGEAPLLPPFFFSTPCDVGKQIVKWFVEGTIWKHLWITLLESILAFVMQTIAREFNLPETVFVQPPEDVKHRARVRIFTPARELPFAGHPTVGTAVLLSHLDGGGRDITLEEQVGPVRCLVEPGSDGGRATFDIPRKPERLGPVRDAAALAAALSLQPSELGLAGFRVENWTAGNPFTFVPVRGLDAIRRARPDMSGATAAGVLCQSLRYSMACPRSGLDTGSRWATRS